MIFIHPPENLLQQYAVDKSDCSTEIADHIEACMVCKAEVATYRQMFAEIKQMDTPGFEFDLAALVVPKLPVLQPGNAMDRFVAGFLVVFFCFCICVPVILFWPYIKNMFSGISAFFISAIVISAATILCIKLLDAYKKFQKHMRLINFN